MAILHRKEEKIQVVLGRLPKKYTHEQFVEMFIKLYSKDWGKIKSAYIKQSQDREPGTVVNMPKPELYLKQVLATYLSSPIAEAAKEETAAVEETPAVKVKATTKKKEASIAEEQAEATKKPKAAAKKKAIVEATEVDKEVKKKAPAKKKADSDTTVAKAKKDKA